MDDEWSRDSQIRTYEVLGFLDFDAFGITGSGQNKGCHVKSLNDQNGYVKQRDALKHEWKIFDLDNDELLDSFYSLDALVEAGWIVD